jgi:hypothetical protein
MYAHCTIQINHHVSIVMQVLECADGSTRIVKPQDILARQSGILLTLQTVIKEQGTRGLFKVYSLNNNSIQYCYTRTLSACANTYESSTSLIVMITYTAYCNSNSIDNLGCCIVSSLALCASMH